MNYFQKKKLAFMSIVNKVKGFIRTITGVLPLTLEGCVDEESIIDYTLYGQSVQDGTPTPETPVEVESVGEYDETTGKYKIPIKVSGKNLLSPQKWVSGQHLDGIIAYPNVNYITSIGENYIEANFAAWRGVASEKFEYAKVNTVGFKINKNQVVDDYIIYYIGLQGYDVDGKKTVFKQLSRSVVADKEYVFKKNNGNFVLGLSTTSVRLCILSRSQAITGLRVYDFYSTNDAETGYEPYHEPITTNIYLDEPLGEGQSINYKKDGLPAIPTFKGTSIITADTTVQPSNAEIEYYSNVKE